MPTRELANQVAETLTPIAAVMGLKVTTVYGGVGQGRQISALRAGIDILVACPGRLEDLIGQRHCDLDRVEITRLHEGTFYAEIELDRGGAKSRISSRPSDAIALAVRFGGDIPIFADEEVLDEAGVLFEADDEEQEVAQFRQFLDEITPEDFAQ